MCFPAERRKEIFRPETSRFRVSDANSKKSRQNNETATSSRPKQALVLVSLLVLFAVVRDRE